MKRIAIMCMAVLLMTPTLFAAGITDATKSLGHMKFAAGLEDNYIFERDIEKPDNRDKFDMEDINQFYGKLALGLTPYFNVYTKLGISDNGEIKDNNLSIGNNLKIETDYGFLWGIGVSGVTKEMAGFKIGLDAQLNCWKADADTVTADDLKATGVSGEIKNIEIQGTPFITRKFEISEGSLAFNPYVGVKISHLKTETDDSIKYKTAGGVNKETSWSLKAKDNVGIVVGSDLEYAEHWALQVEGRFIDETAITAGGTYRF